MAYSLKKMWAAMAVSLVAATSFVGANNVVYNSNCDYNACCPVSCGSTGGDLYFTAEALILKACEDGLAYGTAVSSSSNSATGLTEIETRVKNVHPKWNVGFRLGLGYTLPCDCWGLALYWTHFNTHAKSHFDRNFSSTTVGTTTTTNYFVPAYGNTNFNNGDSSNIDFTEARWKLRLDVVDIELGRPVCISQCLTIRPHIGVRAAWINQSYNIENGVHLITTDAETVVQDIRLKANYQGVGLRGGLDTQWDLGCGMSLYGTAAASVLYGNFDVESDNFYTLTAGAATSFDAEQKDDFCACRAVTDASIGLRWRQCLCNDSVALTLQVGWEHHLFFDQNKFEDFVALDGSTTFNPAIGEVKNPQVQRGDLCIKGVTISARLDF
ncbi:MAG: hypothetical protein H0X51_05585 [Parachlamydiaceae bacterium]|nr:hypothetical protein [Parachlamydiaceae bacterium]